jgi:hypothetical protein
MVCPLCLPGDKCVKMKNWIKPNGLWLMGILTVGLVMRIAFCFFLSLTHLHTDTFMYFHQAFAILAGKYINYAPNGYPLLIALSIKLFSPQLLNYSLLWTNIIMGTCTIWLVYQITLMTFKNRMTALIAAGLMALYPNQLNYTRWILTEIPCTFFLVACFYLYLKNFQYASGLMLGFSALFRTPILPIGLLIAGYHLLSKGKVAYKLLAGLILPLLMIASYCYFVTGRFSITGNETVNVVYAVSSYTKETKGEIDWTAPKHHPEITTSSQAWKLYFIHAKKNPIQFIRQRISSLWELWGFYPTSLGGTRGVPSRLLIGLCNLVLIIGSGWCFWKNKKKRQIYLILLPFLSLSAIYTLLVSLARYTVPMEPFLIILTSWSITTVISHIRTKKKAGMHLVQQEIL